MTILNWNLAPDSAAMMCDSVVSYGGDNQPWSLSTKHRVIPHLGIILGVRGVAAPAYTLWSRLMGGWLVRDIDDLVPIAPGVLQSAYAGLMKSGAIRDEDAQGCLIVAFGWSRARRRIIGYVFDADRDFAPGQLADGAGVLPELPSDGPATLLEIGLLQQAADLARPYADRDHIGGR